MSLFSIVGSCTKLRPSNVLYFCQLRRKNNVRNNELEHVDYTISLVNQSLLYCRKCVPTNSGTRKKQQRIDRTWRVSNEPPNTLNKIFQEKNKHNIAIAKKYEISNVKLTPFARSPSCNWCLIVEQFSARVFQRKWSERRLRAYFYAKMQFSFLLQYSQTRQPIYFRSWKNYFALTLIRDASFWLFFRFNEWTRKNTHKKNIEWM